MNSETRLSLYPATQAHDEIESASTANVPMFLAALCVTFAMALMGAAVWFAGKFAVAGALRLFNALA